jgi:hypothetical protein
MTEEDTLASVSSSLLYGCTSNRDRVCVVW